MYQGHTQENVREDTVPYHPLALLTPPHARARNQTLTVHGTLASTTNCLAEGYPDLATDS